MGIAQILQAAYCSDSVEQADNLEPYTAIAPGKVFAQPDLAAGEYRLKHSCALLEDFVDQMPGRRSPTAKAEYIQLKRLQHTIGVVLRESLQRRLEFSERIFHLGNHARGPPTETLPRPHRISPTGGGAGTTYVQRIINFQTFSVIFGDRLSTVKADQSGYITEVVIVTAAELGMAPAALLDVLTRIDFNQCLTISTDLTVDAVISCAIEENTDARGNPSCHRA